MKKIVVTERQGTRFRIKSFAQKPAAIIGFADRTMVFLDNIQVLQSRQLEQIQPDVIFNCGAYTAVDKR
jgi:dTDP-4-dehydrorhamnose reductase